MGCPEVIRWTTLKPVSVLKKLFSVLETNETELKPVSVKQKRP